MQCPASYRKRSGQLAEHRLRRAPRQVGNSYVPYLVGRPTVIELVPVQRECIAQGLCYFLGPWYRERR